MDETVEAFLARGGEIKRLEPRKLKGANLPEYTGRKLDTHPISVKSQGAKTPIPKKTRIFLKKQHRDFMDAQADRNRTAQKRKP